MTFFCVDLRLGSLLTSVEGRSGAFSFCSLSLSVSGWRAVESESTSAASVDAGKRVKRVGCMGGGK